MFLLFGTTKQLKWVDWQNNKYLFWLPRYEK